MSGKSRVYSKGKITILERQDFQSLRKIWLIPCDRPVLLENDCFTHIEEPFSLK